MYAKLCRYAIVFAIAIVLVIQGRSPALAVTPRHYTELEFAPAPTVVIPDYERFQLANGMTVYLLEDHELPLVYGSAMIRTGDRLEPADKVGLASVMGEVMRSGGTVKHPGNVLNDRLEQRAASVETGTDTTSGSASFMALSEDLTEVFGLFAEVLRQPAFPPEKIEFSKYQWQGSIARRNDDPDSIAGREFGKLIYGADSPYARSVEYASLNNISREDLVQFHQQFYQPQNVLLGIVGDFAPDQMRSLIEQQFSDWQNTTAAQPEIPTATQATTGGVYLVDLPQLTQSSVQMGHLGGQLRDPDRAALSVLNEILNGLGGRLVNSVRSRQGLAYSVYAYWSPQFDFPGLFVAGGQTRSTATVPLIRSILAEIEQVRTAPVTDAELSLAKDSVLNAFIFNFNSPFQILSRVMRYDYYGYPQDFIFQYQQQVEATTIAQIQQAAQTHLTPDKIVTLVVGKASEINPPLSNLNQPVTPIDVTIPPASSAS